MTLDGKIPSGPLAAKWDVSQSKRSDLDVSGLYARINGGLLLSNGSERDEDRESERRKRAHSRSVSPQF